MVSLPMHQRISRRLRNWYCSRARDFPWRHERDPFRIFVAEMLLRKTRAEAVTPVYLKLVDRWSGPSQLAAADPSELAGLLRPLGLHNVRTNALIDAAAIMAERYAGLVPRDSVALQALPHAGRYVANATLCFAFGERRPVVDSNVARVFSRAFAATVPREIHKADEIWEFAYELLPSGALAVKQHNWALLDLGALLCIPRAPRCAACPIRSDCLHGRATLT